MLSNDLRTMETFADRLKKAAAHKQVKYSATEIGRSLGLAKQTVHRWMGGSAVPSPENVFLIADRWEISARWLATGEGYLIPVPSDEKLSRQEQELIATYRSAQPDGKNSMRAVAKAISKALLGAILAVFLLQPDHSWASFSSKVASVVYYVKSLMRFVLGRFRSVRVGLSE